MQFMLIVCAALAVGLPTHAATPTKEPTSIKVESANDLAVSCTVTPSSKISFARLNFCTDSRRVSCKRMLRIETAPRFAFPTQRRDAARR